MGERDGTCDPSSRRWSGRLRRRGPAPASCGWTSLANGVRCVGFSVSGPHTSPDPRAVYDRSPGEQGPRMGRPCQGPGVRGVRTVGSRKSTANPCSSVRLQVPHFSDGCIRTAARLASSLVKILEILDPVRGTRPRGACSSGQAVLDSFRPKPWPGSGPVAVSHPGVSSPPTSLPENPVVRRSRAVSLRCDVAIVGVLWSAGCVRAGVQVVGFSHEFELAPRPARLTFSKPCTTM